MNGEVIQRWKGQGHWNENAKKIVFCASSV